MDSFAELREAIESVKLVDAHAHNLVALDSSIPFISCFSEATGDALLDAPHTLSFKRSLREIAELYGCEPSLLAVVEHRVSSGLEAIASKCFEAANFSAVLIDDGLKLDKMFDIDWHTNLAPTVGRILRIEHLAQQILDEGLSDGSAWTLETFTETFIMKLKSAANGIVAIKSIAAYRSGLEINPEVTMEDADKALSDLLNAGKPYRITNKSLIDYIFVLSLVTATSFGLPMQIHTGFGDKDLDLRFSSPLHLRKLLEDDRFAKSRIVLLHASYPYSKEASYLASVYSQVYLDFGLAIPKLSFHGMISSVKELLELAPINKVMFSTDGYAFPETFYLGAKGARKVLFSVLCDACKNGELSVAEAVEAAQDIFAQNAIRFYKIDAASNSVRWKDVQSLLLVDSQDKNSNKVSLVRLLWVDASGQHRCRVIPRKRFYDVVKTSGVGLAQASMAMSSFSDGPSDGSNLTATGEIRLMPDFSTKQKIPWVNQEEMVLANMHLKPGNPWDYCPRETLRRVCSALKDEFNLVINAGFENEFFLLKSVQRAGNEEWIPFDSTPYCSTSGYDGATSFLHEVLDCLESLDVPVEQLHAESGNGQFEIPLGHTICTKAADNLIFARETIKAVARKQGLLATFIPKYSLEDIGSGCHVHISLWENGKNVFMGSPGSSKNGISVIGEKFMAGVLCHLPSILAFTAPIPNSYDRIQPNTWSGAYLCWGKENREAPLRTACPPGIPDGVVSNFEIKSFDACANPHLGLSAIIAAGIDGLRRNLTLPDPIDENPATRNLKMLPRSLSESLEALQSDTMLRDLIGENLVVAVEAVRKAEINHYSKNKDAWMQLIHRY
ncbi:unnamed protein product [Rhodiola kirilowii]